MDRVELTSLLFQAGYLAIKEKLEDGLLFLSYPNREVKKAYSRIKVGIGVNFDSSTKELDGWYSEIL